MLHIFYMKLLSLIDLLRLKRVTKYFNQIRVQIHQNIIALV